MEGFCDFVDGDVECVVDGVCFVDLGEGFDLDGVLVGSDCYVCVLVELVWCVVGGRVGCDFCECFVYFEGCCGGSICGVC